MKDNGTTFLALQEARIAQYSKEARINYMALQRRKNTNIAHTAGVGFVIGNDFTKHVDDVIPHRHNDTHNIQKAHQQSN